MVFAFHGFAGSLKLAVGSWQLQAAPAWLYSLWLPRFGFWVLGFRFEVLGLGF